jgi:lauroyl/myristoyl acyltransferase
VLSRVVARNMRSAGVYDRTVFREYFAQVAGHLSNGLRIFRLARSDGAVGTLARSLIDVDDSITHLRRALGLGRGAIVVPPHVCNYLLTLARLNQEVPVCVYLRWSDDRQKREIKRAWCEATGLRVILEPANAADPASRAAACVEALREGAALVMTPDIAQKSDKGVPVRLLGRELYLPTGPASIAMLAEAPLVPVFGRLVGKTHVIYARRPISVEPLPRARGGRQKAIGQAMQTWAGHFEAFLRECPQAWFLWADSRWTRVFHGDPRYCGTPDAPDGRPQP